jgi:hypothetical protein
MRRAHKTPASVIYPSIHPGFKFKYLNCPPTHSLVHRKPGRILYAYCFSDIASRWLNKGIYKLFIPRPRQRPSVSGGLFVCAQEGERAEAATTFFASILFACTKCFLLFKAPIIRRRRRRWRQQRTVSLINLRKKLGRFCVAAAAASPHY